MGSERKLVWLIVLIILVIVVSVLLFRNCYKTEQERTDNMNKLYLGIGAGIVGVILLYYLMQGNGDDQEYGIRDSIRGWWRGKVDKARAKKDGGIAAEREEKARQRANKAEQREAVEKVRAGQTGRDVDY